MDKEFVLEGFKDTTSYFLIKSPPRNPSLTIISTASGKNSAIRPAIFKAKGPGLCRGKEDQRSEKLTRYRPSPSELGFPGLLNGASMVAFPCNWPEGSGLPEASYTTA